MTTQGIEGLNELLESLAALPETLQTRILKAWTLRKARDAAKAAQAAAPRGKTGNLRKGIVAKSSGKARLQKLGSVARAVVIGKAPARHFHLVNLGTRPRMGKTKRGTPANRGVMPANPFFSRAVQPIMAQAQASLNTELAAEVQKALDAAVKRTLQRGGSN